MPRPNESIYELWEMEPEEFNQWRRDNDLPKLLEFFKEALPHFEEWQTVNVIDDATFLAPTGQVRFLRGDGPVFLSSSTGPNEFGEKKTTVYFHDNAFDVVADRRWQADTFCEIRYTRNWEIPFIPYFKWLRTQKQVTWFRIAGESNAFTKDLEYRRTEAYDTAFSRAYLFHTHKVLKLGGVTIQALTLDERNLDFVDLDYLTVIGRGGSRHTNISYSSCRNVVLKDYDKPFVTFEKCQLSEPVFENCELYGFEFIDCGLSRPVFRNCRLSKVVLSGSVMGQVDFEKCDLIDVRVNRPSRASAETLGDFYKRLRVAFQAQGNRREASHYFYEQRFQELKAHLVPLIPRDVGLPGLFHLPSLYRSWRWKQMNSKRVRELLLKNLVNIFKILFVPKHLFRLIRAKVKVIPHAFDWLLWGFGERPSRVFLWMAAVILGFGIRFYVGDSLKLRGQIGESVSCSALNFSTIGCQHSAVGDTVVEAILGAILLGIMVSGFANRTRF
jgi:uncharacterized protein YjbI with pentapeptide repeats